MEPPECPVCLQPFDGESTIPRVLACGHSTCESCLINLPKPPFPRTIRCPACTQLVTFPHPHGPSALPKNIDLLRISSSLLQSNSNPNPVYKPKTPTIDFIPNLWNREFFNNWKDWIVPEDAISVDSIINLDGFCSDGKIVNSKVSLRCSMKRNQKVSLFKVGSFMHSDSDENRFKYSYLAKAIWVLFKLGDGALAELELILRSSLMEYRICTACGLWYNNEDDNLYLVCDRKQTNLLNVTISEVDVSTFAMMGMELCETVSRLQDVELVTGCTSLSCFGIDDFGHIFIDLNEVLIVGGRVQKMCTNVSSAQNDDSKRLVSNVISEINAFPSPEVLVEFVQKECVDLKFPKSTCVVGYSSDLWSLACVLLRFLVGKPFVEETNDYLCSYILKLVNGNACDCEGLHMAWLDKVSCLLDSRLDSDFVTMKELLCKCLCHDPRTRPLVDDIWKCMRELIISPKFDVNVSTKRKTTNGTTYHCLLLGDLLWSSNKANKVDGKNGMMNDLKDETLVVGSDVIEGVSKNSLTCTNLKGHHDCISGLAIGGGFLFSSSFDKTINVWSLQGLNHVHTFKGHEHKVMALVFVEREVPLCISGDNGGDIFVWSVKLPLEEKPIKRLNEEKDWRYSGIHALEAVSESGFLYTGSGDKSVKAWSLHDYSLSCTMNGHKSVVCSLVACNGVLYSGSWDGTIRLWGLSDHSPLAVLGEEAPAGSVFSLAAHTNTLVAAHENGCIKIWNKDVPLDPIRAHLSSIFSVYMEGQWLFSGGWNKTVVVQKLSTVDESQVDVTEIGSIAGDSVVTALHYWQGRLFVAHADGTIKVYNSGG